MVSSKNELNRRVFINCDLGAAYLRHNAAPFADLPNLIAAAHGMMENLRTVEFSVKAWSRSPLSVRRPGRSWRRSPEMR